MSCIDPVFITDGTGRMNVPCGKCLDCRSVRARTWATRLIHENKFHKRSAFVTLTYRDEDLPEKGTLKKKDVQDFLKNLRLYAGTKIGRTQYYRPIRYYFGGEYGPRHRRPHYHGIVFNLGLEDKAAVEKAWNKGFVSMGNVTDYRCGYVAGYIVGKDYGLKNQGCVPEFSLMSRRPGIGDKFARRYADEIGYRGFIVQNGFKVPIPRFYLERVYNTEDKKNLREERRVENNLETLKKELDMIKEKGYSEKDLFVKMVRQKTEQNLKAKQALKQRKF